MSEKAKTLDGIFEHVILEGTSYEIGKQQGDCLKKNQGAVDFFTSKTKEGCPLSDKEMDDYRKYFDTYCPGINEEIDGFADALGVKSDMIVYYAFSASKVGACSHAAILPCMTKDQHVLVGRNYEYAIEDELRLCTTKVTGKFSHIGFSLLQFGRYEGMNEHGLSISMSSGIMGSQPKKQGLKFWPIFRTVLEEYKAAYEALDYIQNVQINDNMNFIIADSSGVAILIEIACEHRQIKIIDTYSKDKFLCSTNHYTLEGMEEFNIYPTKQSYQRYNILKDYLIECLPKITKENLKTIFTTAIPKGLYCPYYSDGMGSLWSLIFDLTEKKAEICFGSGINKWYTSLLNGNDKSKQYSVKIYNKKSPKGFWRNLSDSGYVIEDN